MKPTIIMKATGTKHNDHGEEGEEPPAKKKAKTNETIKNKSEADAAGTPITAATATVTYDPFLLTKRDIWLNILSFVGHGHFIFIAGVSRQFKEWYLQYFSTLDPDELKRVTLEPYDSNEPSKPTATQTFYSAAFSSMSCAKFWDRNTKDHPLRLHNNRVCRTVTKHGCCDILQWAHKQKGYPWDESTCKAAARGGRMDMLRYVRDNGCPWDEETCSAAAAAGHLEILKYALDNNCPSDAKTMVSAACCGQQEVMRYLHEEKNFPWTKEVCTGAALRGHLNCLRYAHENGCALYRKLYSYAALSGQLEILKYAHENGCPWDEGTCSSAAIKGQLHILKYAHENGCPWDELVCAFAAQEGSLECLQYARNNGCPWDERTIRWARRKGQNDVAQWAIDNGCPAPPPDAADYSSGYSSEDSN